MYEIGTLILYDKSGVYRIDSVGTPPIRGTTGKYYKLCAVFSGNSEIIYSPVDTPVTMRSLISSSEAIHYLELFPRLEPPAFRSGKTTELAAHYQGMLTSYRVEDCLLLIQEIHIKQRKMIEQEKHLGQIDTKYLKLAEKLICEEFAAVLNTTPDLIRERLYAATKRMATA